ncbi:hypothetical protein JR316_0003976 [Psilocybe cubensis]|uniref:Uncharacterized protein n=2 Tax=Psilocybe cubensis TaxID=181762 RepID=A0A8H7Y1D1_PSICU|nr:hypothetical protein JR316_0003976 [Psilocybe cubensis]KAH9484494.1 hypothetical protein JR316_0003976 [Psilocybe cubensis]
MSYWIFVDDANPAINYVGPWIPDHGSQDTVGTFGLPVMNTLHGVATDASLSYAFKGTSVQIIGTLQYSNVSGPVTNPSWECFVDSIAIPVQTYAGAESRLVLCHQDVLLDEVEHTITLNVHVSNERMFWFDAISYLPSSSVSLDGALLTMDVPGPNMQFSPGWSKSEFGYVTSTPGLTFQFNFSGITLLWIGYYDQRLPNATSSGSYTIDDGDEIMFLLNGSLASFTGNLYNQIFFQTPLLSSGIHNLQVTFNGNSQSTPLTLNGIYIQNGTSSTTNSTSTPPSFTTPISNSIFGISTSTISTVLVNFTSTMSTITSNMPREAESPSLHPNSPNQAHYIAPIVGGIIGGLAILTACILGAIYIRKRRSRLSFRTISPLHSIEPI